ncbi:hypothetical protein Bbelb_385770 [Branchiostoma belcheri]|nr:hypothetical protein Bbelb_385770 [Branchiostoma belcheri]
MADLENAERVIKSILLRYQDTTRKSYVGCGARVLTLTAKFTNMSADTNLAHTLTVLSLSPVSSVDVSARLGGAGGCGVVQTRAWHKPKSEKPLPNSGPVTSPQSAILRKKTPSVFDTRSTTSTATFGLRVRESETDRSDHCLVSDICFRCWDAVCPPANLSPSSSSTNSNQTWLTPPQLRQVHGVSPPRGDASVGSWSGITEILLFHDILAVKFNWQARLYCYKVRVRAKTNDGEC